MCVYHCFSEILLFESFRSFLGPLSCLPKSFLLAKQVDTPQNMHRIVFWVRRAHKNQSHDQKQDIATHKNMPNNWNLRNQ